METGTSGASGVGKTKTLYLFDPSAPTNTGGGGSATGAPTCCFIQHHSRFATSTSIPAGSVLKSPSAGQKDTRLEGSAAAIVAKNAPASRRMLGKRRITCSFASPELSDEPRGQGLHTISKLIEGSGASSQYESMDCCQRHSGTSLEGKTPKGAQRRFADGFHSCWLAVDGFNDMMVEVDVCKGEKSCGHPRWVGK